MSIPAKPSLKWSVLKIIWQKLSTDDYASTETTKTKFHQSKTLPPRGVA